MKKADVVVKVAEKSGVSEADCEKVLDALEKVLGDELGRSEGIQQKLDKVLKVLNLFKK